MTMLNHTDSFLSSNQREIVFVPSYCIVNCFFQVHIHGHGFCLVNISLKKSSHTLSIDQVHSRSIRFCFWVVCVISNEQ